MVDESGVWVGWTGEGGRGRGAGLERPWTDHVIWGPHIPTLGAIFHNLFKIAILIALFWKRFAVQKIVIFFCNFYILLCREKVQYIFLFIDPISGCMRKGNIGLAGEALSYSTIYSTARTPSSMTWVPLSRLAFGDHCRAGWQLGLWPSAITILQCAASLVAGSYKSRFLLKLTLYLW